MEDTSFIPLFIASGVFGAVGFFQFCVWLVLVHAHTLAGCDDCWVKLASSAAYCVIGSVFFLGAKREHIRLLRVRRGRCQHCGYRLKGNVSGICPECGAKTR